MHAAVGPDGLLHNIIHNMVESLIVDALKLGHSTKDTAGGPKIFPLPYIVSIHYQSLNLKRTTSLQKTKNCPKVSFIRRFNCIMHVEFIK